MKFFKTEEERDLWLKLNAALQIEWEKSLKYIDSNGTKYPAPQSLRARSMMNALEVAKNQLEYDEGFGSLRFTNRDLIEGLLRQIARNDKNK